MAERLVRYGRRRRRRESEARPRRLPSVRCQRGVTPGNERRILLGCRGRLARAGSSKSRRYCADSRSGPISRMVARLAESKFPMLCGGPVPAARGKQQFRREPLTCSGTQQLRTKNSRARRPGRDSVLPSAPHFGHGQSLVNAQDDIRRRCWWRREKWRREEWRLLPFLGRRRLRGR
jgi:hypothetical protein